ncbi:unnamed protein product [Moneuplotes crassus]|uniref:LITAF domain-containing protein n=1 Tax=Euplotes crassus TaxID=5936 RepID=A0AAD2CXH5_EUPCR|nr:unnamed protein product [Moneuplotes crassus]
MESETKDYNTISQHDPLERAKATEDSTKKEIVAEELPILAYCKHCCKTYMTRIETECDCTEVPLCICMSVFFLFCYCCCPSQMRQTRKSYHICTNCDQKILRVTNSLATTIQMFGRSIENTCEDVKEGAKTAAREVKETADELQELSAEVRENLEQIKKHLPEDFEKLKEEIEEGVEKFQENLGNEVDQLKEQVPGEINRIEEKIEDALEDQPLISGDRGTEVPSMEQMKDKYLAEEKE